MSTIAAEWPMMSAPIVYAEFEAVIGKQLTALWETVSTEQVPESLLAATNLLFDCPQLNHRNEWHQSQSSQARSLWSTLFFFDVFVNWRKKSLLRSERRMIERAIRKQGIAWILSEDLADQVNAIWNAES